jgi:hypothetical protein
MQQCISQLQGGKSAPAAAPLDLLTSHRRFTNLLIAESFDPWPEPRDWANLALVGV